MNAVTFLAMKFRMQNQHIGHAVDKSFRLLRVEGMPIETARLGQLRDDPQQGLLCGEGLAGSLVGFKIEHRQARNLADRHAFDGGPIDAGLESPFAKDMMVFGAVGMTADGARQFGLMACGLGGAKHRGFDARRMIGVKNIFDKRVVMRVFVCDLHDEKGKDFRRISEIDSNQQ